VLTLVLGPLAHAAPLVYDHADAATARALVLEATGQRADPAIDIDTLRTRGPTVLGDARLRQCTLAPSTNRDIDTEYHRAAGAFAHLDPATTVEAADLAVAKLGCLTEPADPVLVGKLFLLRGVMEAERNREAIAREELRTAWAFAPDQKWDDAYPPTARPWFDEERTAPVPFSLTLAPRADAPDGPWLDGRRLADASASVGPGLHLVQYVLGTRTLTTWVVLAGDATVVQPSTYSERALGVLADGARRDELAPLLRASFPAGTVWLASEGWVVEATIGADAVTMEVRASPAPPVTADEKKRKKKSG
jgi:hypothetical protein